MLTGKQVTSKSVTDSSLIAIPLGLIGQVVIMNKFEIIILEQLLIFYWFTINEKNHFVLWYM